MSPSVRGAMFWEQKCALRRTGETAVRVNPAEIHTEAVAELKAEVKSDQEFVRAATWVLSLLPIIYGLLTFWFSNELWITDNVNNPAMEVPGAPESWGAVFIFAGLGTLVFSELKKRIPTVTFAILGAMILATFMFAFLLSDDYPDSLNRAVPYGAISILYIFRARRAWVE